MISNAPRRFMEARRVTEKRILLAVDAFYIGGTETHVLSLAKELIKNNIFVAIVANKTGNLVNSYEALNCPIYHIEFPKSITLEETYETELIKQIELIIETEKISHVHIHQTSSGYLAGKAAKNRDIPTIITIHGTYYPNHEIEELLKLSDEVICVSPPLCDYVKTFGVEHPFLVPNGINLEDYPIDLAERDIRNELKIPEDATILLYASRITWAKAHVCSIFLRACKDLKVGEIPNLHVIVVGDGNKLDEITSLARTIEGICGEAFIHIVGEQNNMHPYYSIADCVVGTGRVALEAMASEKQVVAVGNHGYFGIVDTNNFQEAWSHYFGDHGSKAVCNRHQLSDDLKKILRDTEQLRHNGIKAREIIEEMFNIQTIVKKILKIYSQQTKIRWDGIRNILYIGWIGFNNLGDELLWNMFKDTCAKYLDVGKFTIKPSLPGTDLKNLDEFDMVVLGGGSLFLPGYLQILQDAIHRGKSVLIWGAGIDWIEEPTLGLLLNDQLTSLNPSFTQKDVDVLEEVLEHALFVGVRGPLTKKAIELMVGNEISAKVKVIGDPALLLQNAHLLQTPEKEKIIGINWGTTFNRLYGANEESVEEQLVETAKRLINKGYKILIYTVWNDDILHCERLYNKINDPDNVVLDKNLYTEQQLITQLSRCKATINFKLYANILSLIANVPSIPLGYRFKVFDFAALLGLPHLVVSTSSQQLTDDLLERVIMIEKNELEPVKQYNTIQQKYISLLESPFTKK